MADNKKVGEQTTLQTKVFNRWISYELSEIPNSKYTKLSNGSNLIELAHILTHKKTPHRNENDQKSNSENCERALKIFQNDGIDVSDFQAKDFDDNNQKVINEFIWKLICHYSIEKSFGSFSESNENVTKENVKNKLLSWAVKRTQTYENVFDFKPYDLAMCALIDSYYPEKINYYALNLDDHQNNFSLLISEMKKLGIPCLIFPDDLIEYDEQIDEKALLTQLALSRIVLEIENNSSEKHEFRHSIKNNLIETPEILTVSSVDQTRAQRRARCVSRLQEHKSEQQIKEEEKNHERRIKEIEKEEREKRHITEEQQKIEKQIAAQFAGNKKAYKKRKLEEKNIKEKLEKKENPIKKEIDDEFEENKEEYEMRKAEE